MASNPDCCLTPDEWARASTHWIEHGAPEDLLNASIYFDLRPLAGNAGAGRSRCANCVSAAAPRGVPRFMKQLADNALRNRAPLNWLRRHRHADASTAARWST